MEREVTQSQNQPSAEQAAAIDLDQLTNAIWEERKGRLDKREIRQALEQLLPDYREARIWGFVPILMRREVSEMLVQGTRPNASALPFESGIQNIA